jgi:hypothetical protein
VISIQVHGCPPATRVELRAIYIDEVITLRENTDLNGECWLSVDFPAIERMEFRAYKPGHCPSIQQWDKFINMGDTVSIEVEMHRDEHFIPEIEQKYERKKLKAYTNVRRPKSTVRVIR